uniref:Uncharacterized protein n=1 Tax=Pseudictyota dubia TaxID=2749911 RepID=A0A7R9ZG84_9STRA|mmetsp:Transcript_4628/g.8042  ORF Transcript_4628/g.8042 Transcript_4628/m.8042 type:complete len:1116 (+) Transcript_4628:404-3751(+)|eukprot:CAMPEP_0197442590 /NCGR_PEP_ID=MMETSP1175-20131217/8572_1 /TAXON_ID=1003142 /ORGANISM="Triceratium dubium, Strain CCMP147" /LENGTH=1115 /DNA_ID=CAMNT_0042973099 /DNA_START=403 /DNA_END=3750 /DNA_ORIENTATION=-
MVLRTRPTGQSLTAPGGPASQVSLQRISNVKKIITALQKALTAEERHKALRAAMIAFDHSVEKFHDEALIKYSAADVLWIKFGFIATLTRDETSINRPYGRSGSTADEVCVMLQLITMIYQRCSIDALTRSFERVGGITLALLSPVIQKAHDKDHSKMMEPLVGAPEATNERIRALSAEYTMERASASLSLLMAILSRIGDESTQRLVANHQLLHSLVQVCLLGKDSFLSHGSGDRTSLTSLEAIPIPSETSLMILLHLALSRFPGISTLVASFPDVLFCFGYALLTHKEDKSALDERRYPRRERLDGSRSEEPGGAAVSVRIAVQKLLSLHTVSRPHSHVQQGSDAVFATCGQEHILQHYHSTPGKRKREPTDIQANTPEAKEPTLEPHQLHKTSAAHAQIAIECDQKANAPQHSLAPEALKATAGKRKRGRPRKSEDFAEKQTTLLGRAPRDNLPPPQREQQQRPGTSLAAPAQKHSIQQSHEELQKENFPGMTTVAEKGENKSCTSAGSSRGERGLQPLAVVCNEDTYKLSDSALRVDADEGDHRGNEEKTTVLVTDDERQTNNSTESDEDGSFWLRDCGNDPRQAIVTELGEMVKRTARALQSDSSDGNSTEFLVNEDAPAALAIVHACLDILCQEQASMAQVHKNTMLLQGSGLDDSLAFLLSSSAWVFHDGTEQSILVESSLVTESTYPTHDSKATIQSVVQILPLVLKALRKIGRTVSTSSAQKIVEGAGYLLDDCLQHIGSLLPASAVESSKRTPTHKLTSSVLCLFSIVKEVCSVLDTITSSPRDVNDDSADITRRYLITNVPGLLPTLARVAEGGYAILPSMDQSLGILEATKLARMHAIATLASLSFVDDTDARIAFARTPRVILLMSETALLANVEASPAGRGDADDQAARDEAETICEQNVGCMLEYSKCGVTTVPLSILEGAAACLRNCSEVDIEGSLCLSSRKQLVQALVTMISDKCGATSEEFSIKLRRFSAEAILNFSSVPSNIYTFSKLGGQEMFDRLSRLVCYDPDRRTRLCASNALSCLASDDVIAESIAKNFSTICSIAQAASSPDEIVGSIASDALQKVLQYVTGTDVRQIMCQIATQKIERPMWKVSHVLMV